MKRIRFDAKHPVTKKLLVGGFNPLAVSKKPFGLRVNVKAA